MSKKKDLPYNTNPYEPNENPPVNPPKPEVTGKRSSCKSGVRGAHKEQKSDRDDSLKGKGKAWKPKGRK